MALKDSLKNKTANEKELLKARALADCLIPLTFTNKGITVNLLAQPREKNGLLEVYVDSAFQGNKRLFIDSPFLYKNPPIMVHDGTYHKQLNRFGVQDNVPNYVEDPQQALKEIIIETVRVLNK